jgi:hypothetical protein
LILSFVGGNPELSETGGCWIGYAPVSSETDTAVTISIRSYRSTLQPKEAFCTMEGHWRTLPVKLQRPLASRTVLVGDTNLPAKVVDVALPEPKWLPDGWQRISEQGSDGGWSVYYGLSTNQSVLIQLVPTSSLERYRGSQQSGVTTVQGRSAVWVAPGLTGVGAPLLMLGDERWLLVLAASGAEVFMQTVQQIADGLSPLPFASSTAPPVIPAPYVGRVAELRDKEGPVIITGWMVSVGEARGRLCDELRADEASCGEPAMDVDWSSASNASPVAKVQHVTLRGNLKGGRLFVLDPGQPAFKPQS